MLFSGQGLLDVSGLGRKEDFSLLALVQWSPKFLFAYSYQ